MRVRAILRLVVLAFAAGVAFTVYWNWRPATVPRSDEVASGETQVAARRGGSVDGPAASDPDPDPDSGAGAGVGDAAGSARAADSVGSADGAAPADDREVASETRNIYIVESRNGSDVFAIWAEEQVDYEDGWNVWSGVRVVIYGHEGADDDIEIRSDRARTTGAGDSQFDEVVFIGNVLATLPSGGRFTTRRIDYDAVTGEVSNCNRNTLLYAGLEVRADCMRFQTAGEVTSASAVAEELRMWQDLQIRSAADGGSGDTGGMPADLSGRADEMRFRPGGELVSLAGDPQMSLQGVAVRGQQLVLDVGPEADELRGLTASGEARVRLSGAVGAEETSAATASESGTTGPVSSQTLTGDEIEIVLGTGDGGVETVSAQAGEEGLARLTLSGFGRLDARRLEVSPGTRLNAHADGEVVWSPQRGSGALRGLTAEALRLTVLEDAIESLDATGTVRAVLEAERAGERAFEGGRLVLGWVNGALQRGLWPRGIAVDVEGRSLRAERANLDPETGAWLLTGDARPQVTAAEFEFAANQMKLGPEGGLEATGLVTGTVGGAYLAAAAALFGEAEAVQLHAGSAQVGVDGSLRLARKVEVVWQTQSLVAGEVLMESQPGRLRARDDVELVAVTGDGEEFVTVSAANLLVEELASEVRVAGQAELRQGSRRIAADTMVVAVDEAGDWSEVQARDAVEFEEDRARGSGVELRYAMATRELRLGGSAEQPALFVYEGVDPPAEYRSNEELHVAYSGDAIVIESTENGRATTSVVPRPSSVS